MAGVAAAYAQALAMLAQPQGKLEDYLSQLTLVKDALRRQERFQAILAHPKISKAEKKEMLANVFASSLDREVLNFLKLLVDKGRMGNFDDICREYRRCHDELLGIVCAQVSSAVALSEQECAALKQALEEKTGKRVVLSLHQDASLIAGIRVNIEGKVLDNSIQTRLRRMKEQVAASTPQK